MCRVCAKCINHMQCNEMVCEVKSPNMKWRKGGRKNANAHTTKESESERGSELQWEQEKSRARTNHNNNVRWIGYFSSDRSCIICGISTYLYVMTVWYTQPDEDGVLGSMLWCAVQCTIYQMRLMNIPLLFGVFSLFAVFQSASTICQSRNGNDNSSIFGMRLLNETQSIHTIQYMQCETLQESRERTYYVYLCIYSNYALNSQSKRYVNTYAHRRQNGLFSLLGCLPIRFW